MSSSSTGNKMFASPGGEPPKYPLKEFSRLTYLMNLIPQKAQKGLTTYDNILTCIDATEHYIAIGSSLGIIFLYDRIKQSIQKLHCETKEATFALTSVKLIEGLNYQVAAGATNGLLTIFQLPSILPGRNKQLRKYTVSDMHTTRVTCFAWSTNSMKLFSGDEQGKVILTELDPDRNECKSALLLKESHKIVQLSYSHQNLLVSTRYKTVICMTSHGNDVIQVGQKERKCLGNFGAQFIPGLCKPGDLTLFASRPGYRLWKADIKGTVTHTYLFKDCLLKKDCPGIDVISAVSPNRAVTRPEDNQFGPLLVYNENLVLTWNDGTLFILDPVENTVVGSSSNLGSLVSLTTCKDEIFILRMGGDLKILRIAQNPEYILYKDQSHSPILDMNRAGSPSTLSAGNTAEPPKKSKSPLSFLFGKMKKTSTSYPEKPPWGYKDENQKEVTKDTEKGFRPVIFQNYYEPGQSYTSVIKPEAQIHSSDALPPIIALPDDIGQIKIETGSEQTSPISSNLVSPAEEAEFLDEMTDRGNNVDNVDSVNYESNDKLNSVDGFENGSPQLMSNSITSIDPVQTDNTCNFRRVSNTVYDNIVLASDSDDIVVQKKPKKPKKKKLAETNSASRSITPKLPSEGTQARNATADNEMPNIKAKEETSKHKDSDVQTLANEAFTGNSQVKPESHSAILGAKDIKELINACRPEVDDSETLQRILATYSEEKDTSLDSNDNPENIGDKSVSEAVSSDEEIDVERLNQLKKQEFSYFQLTFETEDQVAMPDDDKHESVTSSTDQMSELSIEPTSAEPVEPPKYKTIENNSKESKDGNIYKTPDTSTEDFYSKFDRDVSSGTLSTGPTTPTGGAVQEDVEVSISSSTESSRDMKTEMNQTADNWSTFITPAGINSLALSAKHVWIVDRTDSLYTGSLLGHTMKWVKMDCPAHQIAVSESGWIVWRLYKGVVYAGVTKTQNYPTGITWTDTARDVTYISVDNTSAWYIKSNGIVQCQKDFSKNRPCSTPKKVQCDRKLIQIKCNSGVVWALTDDRKLLVRTGMSVTAYGTTWKEIDISKDNIEENIVIADISLGDSDRAWIVDMFGCVWFMSGTSRETPEGMGGWCQVSMSDYLMYDSTSTPYGMIKSQIFDNIIDPVSNLTKVFTGYQGGVIATNSDGIWVCLEFKNSLSVCRGTLIGHKWELASPIGMASAAKWTMVSAACVVDNKGIIWACQPNGDIFSFPCEERKFTPIISDVRSGVLNCLTAASDAVWCLMHDGSVLVRSGMTPRCPNGNRWIKLDLSQLDNRMLTHICCGGENVWAVDKKGQVYIVIGLKPPAAHSLPKAWMPVDTPSTGATLTHVYTGPTDTMVWAIDSRKNVWARTGVSKIPVGDHWVHVSGTQAQQLSISKNCVWALNPHGEILCRYGITSENEVGNYWKKIPGKFVTISVTPSDTLWAISKSGKLHQRQTTVIKRVTDYKTPIESAPYVGHNMGASLGMERSVSNTSDGDDWEML